MRDEDYKGYKSRMKQTSKGEKITTDCGFEKYFKKEWRTYHVFDHKPMWVKIQIDDSQAYLEYILEG